MPVSFRRLLFCLLLVFCFSHEGWAAADDARADSVMERVFTYTRRSGLTVSSYTSQLYVRTRLTTRRRGRWIRFVPGCLIDGHDQFRLKIVSQRKGGLQFVPDFRRDDSQPHAVVPQLP